MNKLNFFLMSKGMSYAYYLFFSKKIILDNLSTLDLVLLFRSLESKLFPTRFSFKPVMYSPPINLTNTPQKHPLYDDRFSCIVSFLLIYYLTIHISLEI